MIDFLLTLGAVLFILMLAIAIAVMTSDMVALV